MSPVHTPHTGGILQASRGTVVIDLVNDDFFFIEILDRPDVLQALKLAYMD